MSDDLLGKVIDKRYRVDRQIGEGGMGVVFQGEHVSVGNRVAIKVLHPEYSKDEEVVRRLAQEARVAGTLGHKNIVQVFDFSQTDDGTHYLVMEFLEGETLADYLAREGPVAPRFIVPVALQVLDGLALSDQEVARQHRLALVGEVRRDGVLHRLLGLVAHQSSRFFWFPETGFTTALTSTTSAAEAPDSCLATSIWANRIAWASAVSHSRALILFAPVSAPRMCASAFSIASTITVPWKAYN